LGAARIADSSVIPAIQGSAANQVVAIASRDRPRAEALRQKHGIDRIEASYEALLECTDIEAVYIPTPTAHHFRWATAALDAGKHVLCEKPIGMNASEVESLIALRDSTGLVCAEAFMVVHHPQWAQVREVLHSGRLGKLVRVDGCFTYFLDDPLAIRNSLDLGGGGVRDIGVYPVVTTRFATGEEPNAVRSHVRTDPRFGTDTYASCVCEFNGFDLHFYCGTQLSRRQSMIFHGTHGWLELSAPFAIGRYRQAVLTMRCDDDGAVTQTEYGTTPDQYGLMIEDFAAVVRGDKSSLVFPLESSLANQKVIDLILSESGSHET
jgi:predicted dehydrogenase